MPYFLVTQPYIVNEFVYFSTCRFQESSVSLFQQYPYFPEAHIVLQSSSFCKFATYTQSIYVICISSLCAWKDAGVVSLPL